MSDLSDLPLFGGPALADPPATPTSVSRGRKAKPAPRPAEAGPRVVVLSLAQNRRLIADLVERYQATPCGPRRAASFRMQILMPLVAERMELGLVQDQQEIELDRIEEAMVRMILGDDQDAGSAA